MTPFVKKAFSQILAKIASLLYYLFLQGSDVSLHGVARHVQLEDLWKSVQDVLFDLYYNYEYG